MNLFIHIYFKWVEKYYCIHLRFPIHWISHVARQKINTEATQEFLKIKPPTFFNILQFNIRRTKQKSPSPSKFTLDHHSSSITQNQLHSKIREDITWQPSITHDDYQLSTKPISPYNENDSRSWRWWYHGNNLTKR